MSEQNVEVVRALYEAFARNDLQAVFAGFAPDVELDASMSGIPGGGVHHGSDGLRKFWGRWLGAWKEVHSDVLGITAAGDQVFGEQRLHGTSRHGISTEAVVYDVFTLKDGLVQRHALFNERQPALEAAGLGAGAIAHDNVEIVRLMNAAFNRGDLDEAFACYAPTAMSGGKLAEVWEYRNRAEALEAVGLSE